MSAIFSLLSSRSQRGGHGWLMLVWGQYPFIFGRRNTLLYPFFLVNEQWALKGISDNPPRLNCSSVTSDWEVDRWMGSKWSDVPPKILRNAGQISNTIWRRQGAARIYFQSARLGGAIGKRSADMSVSSCVD